MTEDSSEDLSEEVTTDSPKKRLWITNDVLAGTITVGFFAITGAAAAGYMDLSALPDQFLWTMLFSMGSVVIWAFGPAFLESLGNLR